MCVSRRTCCLRPVCHILYIQKVCQTFCEDHKVHKCSLAPIIYFNFFFFAMHFDFIFASFMKICAFHCDHRGCFLLKNSVCYCLSKASKIERHYKICIFQSFRQTHSHTVGTYIIRNFDVGLTSFPNERRKETELLIKTSSLF